MTCKQCGRLTLHVDNVAKVNVAQNVTYTLIDACIDCLNLLNLNLNFHTLNTRLN